MGLDKIKEKYGLGDKKSWDASRRYKTLVFLLPLLVIALVNAGMLLYYEQVIADIEVTQPIRVAGNLEYTIKNAMAGDTVTGERYNSISNYADFPIDVVISNDAPEGIIVIYKYSTCANGGCSVYQILEGDIITIPEKEEGFGSGVLLRIYYELDKMLESGDYTVTTTIDETE